MSEKIYSRFSLSRILKKRRDKKVVFTNGCFDLIHPGHLQLLQKAKKLGDILVVAVNSDSSVKKLKGADRPVLREMDRAKILSAFYFVDYVTIFSEETPEKLIRMLQPDILVKGADYKSDEIVGSGMVKKVVRISLVKNFSTSGLIQRILRGYGKKK